MAVKRSFCAGDPRQCICLTCRAQVRPGDLHDDQIYQCTECGQKMTVDRYGSRVVLTLAERQDLRRRIPPEAGRAGLRQSAEISRLIEENRSLRAKLDGAKGRISRLRRESKDWQQAAEGLARMIEELSGGVDGHAH